jgi:hypothetical protein
MEPGGVEHVAGHCTVGAEAGSVQQDDISYRRRGGLPGVYEWNYGHGGDGSIDLRVDRSTYKAIIA